jgi:ATP-binding cassette subfamily F protein 3
MDKQLANPDNTDHNLYNEYEKVKRQLDQTMYEWELSNEQLDAWQNKKTW